MPHSPSRSARSSAPWPWSPCSSSTPSWPASSSRPSFPAISTDLGLSSGQAGALFLLGRRGDAGGLLRGGLVSARLKHRGTILLSVLGMAAVLVGALLRRLALGACGPSSSSWGCFAGLQLPSSVATITGTVKPDDWGKALSVQQMAPPLSLVVGPLIAAGLLTAFTWNTTLLWVAGLGVVLGAGLPLRLRRHRRLPGRRAQPEHVKPVVSTRSFWVMIFLFALGMGAQVGIFTMLPLYLTAGDEA